MSKSRIKITNPKLAVREDLLRYMTEGIRHVCETFKKRLPGSQSERDAQDFFHKELESYSDSVVTEGFDLHPHAFMGFIPASAVLTIFAALVFVFGRSSIILASLAAAAGLVSVLMFLFEFLFYREFVDFLFPKRKSANVFARRKPSGEVQRRIIFGGHTDAANEWTYSMIGERKALAPVMISAILSVFVALVYSWVHLTYVILQQVHGLEVVSKFQGGWLIWSIFALATILPSIAIFFFINYKVVVDGANDNLTANYITMAVLKDMAEEDRRFEHTEVCCLLSGSEEAGLRGAKAFAKAHREEFLDPNIETIFISLDTMREVEELRICRSGCTGTVLNDLGVVDLIHKAGLTCGVDIPTNELYPGATDCAGFSQSGLRASGFTGVSHDAKRYYHTRFDTADNIDPDCIALSLNICKAAMERFDSEGAPLPKK